MKKIEEYIEKIYRNFDEKDEETRILKEETKAHLLEEIDELKKTGLSEEESISKAILNFGSEKIVIRELNLILKKQSKFSMILKKLTLFFFVVSCIFLSIYIADEFIHRGEPNPFITDNNSTAYVFDIIENKVKSKDVIDLESKNEITQILDDFNVKNNNGLYYIRISREGMPDLDYEYKKDVSKDMIKEGNGGVSGIYNDKQKKWSIYYNRTDKQANYDYKVTQEIWDKMINRVPNRLGQISNYLFVVSGALLCVYIFNKIYLKSSISNK